MTMAMAKTTTSAATTPSAICTFFDTGVSLVKLGEVKQAVL
jgi:hypothetical protein